MSATEDEKITELESADSLPPLPNFKMSPPRNREEADAEADIPDLPDLPVPPDGGWGWVVVFASFMTNVIVDGVCFSFGMFYLEFINHFGSSRGKTAWVGSLLPGMYLGIGPLVGALANKFGCRIVTVIGAIFAAFSFIICTFSPTVDVLIFTYGIMGGIGFGLMYLPAIVIVGFYFDKRRAFATGLAVCGSGIGTLTFAPFIRYLLDQYGWKGAQWILAGITLNGVVCGAFFRPLGMSKKKVKRRWSETDEKPKRGIIMQKIMEEKKRQRTISTGSLDGTVITKDNKHIIDPETIKCVQNRLLTNLMKDEQSSSAGSLAKDEQGSAGNVSNGGACSQATAPPPTLNLPALDDVSPGSSIKEQSPLLQTSIAEEEDEHNSNIAKSETSLTATKTDPQNSLQVPGPYNKQLERVKATGRVRQRTVTERSDDIPIWRRISNASEGQLTRSNIDCARSADSIHRSREAARPLYRADIFYSGSVTSIAQYKSQADMSGYIASVTSIPDAPNDGSLYAKCLPMCHVLKQMFDFSLLKSITFVILCTASVLAMTGFFTPFVYIIDDAIQLGVAPVQAAFLLSILGINNTVGRVLTGLVADHPRVDCLLIHNFALVIAGLSTALVPLMHSYAALVIFCCVFGMCIAAFISLRSIVLVELLGLEKLTNSFGLLLLFQGIASVVGSPIAGFIYDETGSYVVSFVVSGALIALAGLICLPLRRIARWEKKRERREAEELQSLDAAATNAMSQLESTM